MITVYGTSNGPQNDIGNYLGLCSKFSLEVTCHKICLSWSWSSFQLALHEPCLTILKLQRTDEVTCTGEKTPMWDFECHFGGQESANYALSLVIYGKA